MKLITEELFLTEAKKTNGNWKISGIFMEADNKNRNGRVYPEQILDSEVNRYIKESVKTNRAIGELAHPQTPQINLDRVSHIVTNLKKENKIWIGEARILNTPMGNVVSGLLEAGVSLGVSSRGVGSIRQSKNGINEVQNDFRLAAIDIVSDPSVASAYVDGVMESANWAYCEEGQCFVREEMIDKHRKEIKKGVSKERQLKMFEEFINSIKN